MKPTTVDLKKSQHGAATLVVVLVLTMIMAVVSITTARTGIMEQKMTGNDLRAREAQEAAEAGLEYGIAWASKNNVPWPSVTGLTLDCPSGIGCPTLPQVTGSSTGEAYNIALGYYRPSVTSDFIRVTSTSKGANDAAITATIQTYVKPGGILTSDGELPPAFVMDGCMANTAGTPEISPPWDDIDGDGVIRY
jgi:Tfp pilus assembly protein PilX